MSYKIVLGLNWFLFIQEKSFQVSTLYLNSIKPILKQNNVCLPIYMLNHSELQYSVDISIWRVDFWLIF